MRIKNLSKIYIYKPDKKLIKGDYTTDWYYKGEEMLNPQQDIDELNRNSAGEIDYEIVKLRIDRKVDIDKGDGISFSPLEVDDDKKVKNDKKPYYLVENKPQIGKTTLYTLITNNGE